MIATEEIDSNYNIANKTTYSISEALVKFSESVANTFYKSCSSFINNCKAMIELLQSSEFEYEIKTINGSKYSHRILYNDIMWECPQIRTERFQGSGRICYVPRNIIDIKKWSLSADCNLRRLITSICVCCGDVDFSETSKLVKIGNNVENEVMTLQQSYENYTKQTIFELEQAIQKYSNISIEQLKSEIYQILSKLLRKQYGVLYYEYVKINNDRESAIIGADWLKRIKNQETNEYFWVEDKAITSKINKYSKLNTYIENRYKEQLLEAKAKVFSGRNNFKFDSRCNSCLGYCVEYYSKYLVYGNLYMQKSIDMALQESRTMIINDNIIVRACLLKYKENMIRVYGNGMEKIIKTLGVESLIQGKYKEFVKTVVELGKKTANFVKNKLNITEQLKEDDKLYDPNLSIRHIAGLADYINEDTIIDIKVRNCITIENVKQVLAYHYLSTKRSDLHIKNVIVYDAVSGKSVEINVENLK